ncbi:MAG: hypothetical protein HRT61_16685, partial [Ekhidna sp.]|nr:hypothetical protein [Ekhidna sp.]
MKNTRVYTIILLLLFGFVSSFSQEVDPSSVSDQQLKEAVNNAQNRGYSQQQIETLARARGYSETEISNLRQRIVDLQAENGGAELTETQLREELGDDYESELEEMKKTTKGVSEIEGKIFGNSLFSNPRLTFAPSTNIPTPVGYRVGAGDEIVIDIWGASEKTYQLAVSPEGTVKIPRIG